MDKLMKTFEENKHYANETAEAVRQTSPVGNLILMAFEQGLFLNIEEKKAG